MSIYAKIVIIILWSGGLVSCFPTAQNNRDVITIETSSGANLDFAVDIARTIKQQQKGLMFVDDLPDNEGMIFLYDEPKQTKFWMKNTVIPLDMLFFDQNNRLVHIEHSAIPGDLSPRGPDTPICSVVELNGGTAIKENISKGAKLMTNLTQECLQSSIN